ncbi:restriction endonuclease subunit S, partial [Nocardioides insulae]|uniref:restriction endonuclease subunit S n=1 Tax=Nocardioides insulae TaxID=394734 RepID=UPI0004917C7A
MSKIDDLIAKLCPGGVEFKELRELFTTRNGYTPSKRDQSAWADGTIPWFRMEDIRENGQILNDSLQHVASRAVKGGRLFPANSIIVATSATIGEHALITVPHLSNQRFTSLSLKPEYEERLDMR